MTTSSLDPIARRALEFVSHGAAVGLGTGRAASAFIESLGERVRQGLRVRAVPTSEGSASLARTLGIPLVDLSAVEFLDVTVDGADEVDPQCQVIKGYGGALLREKIVAAASRKFVILVGPEKLVPMLGTRGKVPVEVVPFGVPLAMRWLQQLGYDPRIRQHEGEPFRTDNNNHVIDCHVQPLTQPKRLQEELQTIPGVVGTGLFLDMVDLVLIQHPDRIEERQRM
ncbi:MAG: ribose-5-phosphate isomerase RpiA [Planctomycetales bacterium]